MEKLNDSWRRRKRNSVTANCTIKAVSRTDRLPATASQRQIRPGRVEMAWLEAQEQLEQMLLEGQTTDGADNDDQCQ